MKQASLLTLERAIQVWTVRTTCSCHDTLCHLRSILSTAELARADRYRFPSQRNAFIIARSSLRILIGYYLKRSPREITFSYGRHGKPRLPDEGALHFNLSHSGNLVVLAFSRWAKIGVDIEYIRPILEMKEIACRMFSLEEAAELSALPAEQQPSAFFRFWTRKEAYVKAVGVGISLPFNKLRVTLRPGKLAALQCPDEADQAKWSIQDIEIDPQYAAALVFGRAKRSVEKMPIIDAEVLLNVCFSDNHHFGVGAGTE